MRKNKIYLIAGISVALLASVGGVGFYIKKQSDNKTALLRARQSEVNDGATQPLTLQDSSGTNIPLNSVQPTPSNQDTSSSLKVDNSPNNSANVQGQTTPQNQANPSAPATSAPKVPGPETFGQYDQYKDGKSALFADIVVGNGAEVSASSKVAVYYKGWLTNGQLFDESRADPKTNQLQPFVFTMGEHNVIAGWEQAIYGMKVGGTRRLVIPPVVGYGAAGHDPIPGNSVLVFDVQLLAVQ